MGSPLPAGREYLDHLLFVTSVDALRELRTTLEDLRSVVGDRYVLIPREPLTIHDIVDEYVRPRLQADLTIEGVVILGSYHTIPSRRLLTYDVDPGLGEDLKIGNIGFDSDEWLVWTDDLYGDRDGTGIVDLPVSRIPVPVRPDRGGLFGFPRFSPPEGRGFRAYRSDDCRFANDVVSEFARAVVEQNVDIAPMRISPPDGAEITGPTAEFIAAHDLDSGSLVADWLYLAMHGFHDRGKRFRGLSAFESLDAVNMDLVTGNGWPGNGVVFAAACWGGLSAKPAVYYSNDDGRPPSRTAADSIALALISGGINAFVGLTGYHYVPVFGSTELMATHGVPLHTLFWLNIASRIPAAQAICEARKTYIKENVVHEQDSTSLRMHVETYWSATCLGLGW